MRYSQGAPILDGSLMKKSAPARPIDDLLELLGQRWVLRVLWELRDGALTFRALSDACGGVPSATLNTRIQELRRAGILASSECGYEITPRGQELGEILLAMNRWSRSWKHAGAWRSPASTLR